MAGRDPKDHHIYWVLIRVINFVKELDLISLNWNSICSAVTFNIIWSAIFSFPLHKIISSQDKLKNTQPKYSALHPYKSRQANMQKKKKKLKKIDCFYDISPYSSYFYQSDGLWAMHQHIQLMQLSQSLPFTHTDDGNNTRPLLMLSRCLPLLIFY